MDSKLTLKDSNLLRETCFIGGEWLAADNGGTIKVDNPANGDLVGSVPNMGAAETKRAIEQASAALPAWRAKTAKERASILRKWFDLMLANQEDLAMIMTAEQGKPLAESRGEIAYAASFIEWFAEEGKRIYGDTIPPFSADRRIVVLKQSIGVCAAITPWNFPSAMITRKVGPALAAGCTMVVKPASQTPLSALALAVLAERAGVPKGIFSVITGSASAIGAEMTSNPMMDEPFGALDALTREQLQSELLQIWQRTGVTIIFVTHSVEEAVMLSDRILVMSAGPGKIDTDMLIDLPRPRDVSSPEFNTFRREVAGRLTSHLAPTRVVEASIA